MNNTPRAFGALLRGLRADLASERRRLAWLRRDVGMDPKVIVRLAPGSRLEIGAGSNIGPYTILDLLGDPLGGAESTGAMLIGRRVAINEFCNLRSGGGGIEIGDGCLLAQYVSIIASNHAIDPASWVRDQPWDGSRQGVRIGEDVWIGAQAVLLPGITVGAGAVIAAGAVVTHDVAAGSIAGGVPARIIGARH